MFALSGTPPLALDASPNVLPSSPEGVVTLNVDQKLQTIHIVIDLVLRLMSPNFSNVDHLLGGGPLLPIHLETALVIVDRGNR